MTQTLDALVIGRAGMDLYPIPPGTTTDQAETFLTDMGGSAGNISVAMARQGASVALAAPVSDDPVGQFVRDRLAEYGVTHIDGSAVDDQARTSLAMAELLPEGSRTVIYRNNAADFGLTTADIGPATNAQLTVVTGTALACEPSRSAALSALRKDRARCSRPRLSPVFLGRGRSTRRLCRSSSIGAHDRWQ